MTLFEQLQASRNEKIDLVRMALTNYTSPYKVSGSDAVTINNLTEFISNNIIFKKRQDYTENDLSNLLYKYSYRYFTQFVTPAATVDIIEMLILYNKYMTFNIGENAMGNIFNVTELFTYEVSLVDDPVNNINQDSSRTYSFSIPYIANEYKSDYTQTFKLNSTQFSANGKILDIGTANGSMLIKTDFELYVNDGSAIKYDLLNDNNKVAEVELTLVSTEEGKSREYNIDTYTTNIIDNFERDINNIIDNIYISDETEVTLTNAGIINGNVTKEILISNKKSLLRNTLEEIKSNNILKNIAVRHIAEYTQDTSVFNYNNPVTGLNINVSSMTQDAVKHIDEQIKHTGIELDELYIIFKNSTNTYNSSDFLASDVTTFEDFLDKLFRWDSGVDDSILIEFNIDVTNYFFISDSPEELDDSTSFETYKQSLKETIKTHLYIYLYKYFILMDIQTLNKTISAEKDRAVNTYEIDQISESKPINYINVVHSITNNIIPQLEDMIDILKIRNNGVPLDITGDKMLSLTFQYKELNKEVYDLFMQDQIETYIANWLTRNGSIKTLFNNIYINNFNESAWELATALDISTYTIIRSRDLTYFPKVKMFTGNTINFREREYMDIVGYFFNSYDDVYYGINPEHKQEIGLFLRSFQDVREYYFKNLLLKSLVNDDEYPLYEYVLLITMALDRYFNQKVSKHKHLDSYTTEDINNFLDSFGLQDLNEYDNFYGSFNYKMSVIRNYNNLIKNKGTRRVKTLIEDMLNDSSNEFEVAINEYYITKSTKDSIQLVKQWFHYGNIYTWTVPELPATPYWDAVAINTVDGEIPYRYVVSGTLYTYTNGAWDAGVVVQTSQPGVPVEGDMWYDDLNQELNTYTSSIWITESVPNTQPPEYIYVDEDGNNIASVGYTWYDVVTKTKYTYIMTPDDTIQITTEIINSTENLPDDNISPADLGIIEYDESKDKTLFISVPEGTTRPITTIKNKVDSNTTVDYDDFIKDDAYWSKDVTQEFINGSDELNLNISKTKYLSISASINMEVAKIMNMYIMSILDNLFEKMEFDLNIESYTDEYISLSNVNYTDLIRYIKFVTAHLGEVISPSKGNTNIEVASFANLPGTGAVETIYITTDTGSKYIWDDTHSQYVQMIFYGVPKISDIPSKLTTFETQLKAIIDNIDAADIDEFLKDKVTDGELVDPVEGYIVSMNRYAYETDIENTKAVPGSNAYLTSRRDGTLLAGKTENTFTDKLRKLLLGFGYSSVDFQNSATFILDLLESTNLISVMEIPTSDYIATKAKYLKLMAIDGVSSQTVNINNLYSVNLRSLLQMLQDYTQNKIFQEDYTLKDSSVTNNLAINNTFVQILELVITTFFERSDSVYEDDFMETILTEVTHDADFDTLPDFMQDFVELLRQETISDTEKETYLPKYNSILNSMNTILSFMTSADEYALLNTVNTVSKNFSDAEYLNFLISLLSFFMSYKVTLYEESHQLDLSNPKETFIFAEDLLIMSELKLEEDWFFDEEIIDVEE